MKTLYLAGPLFTEAEQDWHRQTKQQLLDEAQARGLALEVIWPYELISQQEIEALGDDARQEIFMRCKAGLDQCDTLLALLDGSQVDDGTAWEVGYFFAKRQPGQRIIGVRTDFRNAGESQQAVVNAMVEMACDEIVSSRQQLLVRLFA